MEVTIEDKGSACFKLTITGNDEVRIKLQKDTDKGLCDTFTHRFQDIAQEVLKEGLNTTTLRGKCNVADATMTLYTDSNTLVKTFKL